MLDRIEWNKLKDIKEDILFVHPEIFTTGATTNMSLCDCPALIQALSNIIL